MRRSVRPRHSHVGLEGTRGGKLGPSHKAVHFTPGDGDSQPGGAGRLRSAPQAPRAAGAARPPPHALRRERARARGRGRVRECASPRSTSAPAAKEGETGTRTGDAGGLRAEWRAPGRRRGWGRWWRRLLHSGVCARDPPAARGEGPTDVPRAPPPPSPPPPHLPRAPGARGLRRLSLTAPRRGPFSPRHLGVPRPGGGGSGDPSSGERPRG